MIYKLQAQAGSRRHSMWCGVAEQTGMPSPTERDEWGACTFFGTVPLLPLARVDGYGVAQPCLAAVIEGGQRHCNSEAYATPSDLSRSSILSGQRSKRGAPYGASCGRERDMAYGPRRPHSKRRPTALATMVTRAFEKVSAHRPRQNYRCAPRSVRHHERPLPWKASRLRDPSAGFWQDVPEGHRSGGSEHRQGTLTITGSNVRLGTEMPVALSLFP